MICYAIGFNGYSRWNDQGMRVLLTGMALSCLIVAVPANARHPQCPALLTDGECNQLEQIMALRDRQPEEYGRQIVEFARLMIERYQACQCDDWLIKWADTVHDGFRQQGK